MVAVVSLVIVINKLCFSRAHYRRGKTKGHGQNATKPNTFASDDFEIARDDVHTINYTRFVRLRSRVPVPPSP